MTTIKDYLDQAIYVRAEIPNEVDRIIDQNKSEILDLNRENQLYDKGVDSNGKALFPRYSPFTIALKKQKGEVYNRVTLLDKGNFYSRFDLLNRNGRISIFSRDPKSSDLVDRYGNIFGLTKENQDKMNNEIIKPRLAKFITKYL